MTQVIARSMAGNGESTSLTSDISSGDLILNVDTFTTDTWPDTDLGACNVTLDLNTDTEEQISVESFTATQLTVATGGRGQNGFGAQAHQAGCTVILTNDAQSMQDVSQHVVDTTRDDHTQYQTKSLLTTAGDTIYATGAGEWARLEAGSEGDVLTMGESVPEWSAPTVGQVVSSPLGSGNVDNTDYVDLSTSADVEVTTGTKVKVHLAAAINPQTAGVEVYMSVRVSGETTIDSDDRYGLKYMTQDGDPAFQGGVDIYFGTGGGAEEALTAGANTFTAQATTHGTGGGVSTVANVLVTVTTLN